MFLYKIILVGAEASHKYSKICITQKSKNLTVYKSIYAKSQVGNTTVTRYEGRQDVQCDSVGCQWNPTRVSVPYQHHIWVGLTNTLVFQIAGDMKLFCAFSIVSYVSNT